MTVYKIVNQINNKVYVGQTTRPLSHRWTQHLRDSVSLDYPLYRAIRKYGIANFTCEVIMKAENIESLNKIESEMIQEFNSMDKNFGYNILPGGNNWKMPQSVKDKISQSLKGKRFKNHISKEKRSEIAKENGSKLLYDDKWAIANGSSEFKVYKAICLQFRTRNQPSIYSKGEYVGTWLTSSACAKDLKIKSNHIRSCLVNKRPQALGYIFERVRGE